MDKVLSQQTIDMMRETVKIDIKNLTEDGNTEFAGITDKMVDAMSEEELEELSSKIIKTLRGY